MLLLHHLTIVYIYTHTPGNFKHDGKTKQAAWKDKDQTKDDKKEARR